jgi:hypothetical protein
MTPQEIRDEILRTQSEDGGKGRLFTVTFRKRTTGELRVMRARLGMKKGLTGRGQSYNPADYNLITAREAGGGYRNIPLDAIISLKVPDGSKHLRGVAV